MSFKMAGANRSWGGQDHSYHNKYVPLFKRTFDFPQQFALSVVVTEFTGNPWVHVFMRGSKVSFPKDVFLRFSLHIPHILNALEECEKVYAEKGGRGKANAPILDEAYMVVGDDGKCEEKQQPPPISFDEVRISHQKLFSGGAKKRKKAKSSAKSQQQQSAVSLATTKKVKKAEKLAPPPPPPPPESEAEEDDFADEGQTRPEGDETSAEESE